MHKRVLVANRGAIACRVIRTLQQMGIVAIAVYSEADADSLHVLHADEAYSLGGGRVADTYIDQAKLFEVMEKAQVDAVHPGYGFLSENMTFAQACEAKGIAFIGPTPEQIEMFGLKHQAKQLAEAANVPLVPGTGLLSDLAEATERANEIGYPLMLKSTAGGGGIGMSVCHTEVGLVNAFETVQRLGAQNFANDGVFLEKFIAQARHVEVQLVGDGKGEVLVLGDRDCSMQRRHQKVIEECPAPNVPEAVRKGMHQSAHNLLASVQYRNAGTVEYIYDEAEQAFYFLEVNTRLQVEHGVTEAVFDVDLVELMLKVSSGETGCLAKVNANLQASGHAIQARVYAENPSKAHQPSTGLLSEVKWPSEGVRVEHWLQAGIEVSAFFDPMLAKVIVHRGDRASAIEALDDALAESALYGVETNLAYLRHILQAEAFRQPTLSTSFLNGLAYQAPTVEVLKSGTMTTLQDEQGRIGYWNVGIPPSGPFDSLAFALGNRLLGNRPDHAGLEITLEGPDLLFHAATHVVLTGARTDAELDGASVPFEKIIRVNAGQRLSVGKVSGSGVRAYLLIKGGIDCPLYLGSRSTFTLGQFGGHAGRALRAGDVLHVTPSDGNEIPNITPDDLYPAIQSQHRLRVLYGPHGAPDFFTDQDIEALSQASWKVHFNSSRTGIRLVGPKPTWARENGSEAGLHPSNIHDNAYAFGTVDFTGDMPVILGPDGPSLGGFVCPFTVIQADLWKLGQLKAGDEVCFELVSVETAQALALAQEASLEGLKPSMPVAYAPLSPSSITPILARYQAGGMDVVCRQCGDAFVLFEYGDNQLDIGVRLRVHALMQALEAEELDGIIELTPGIRSLQVHFDFRRISQETLIKAVRRLDEQMGSLDDIQVPTRRVYLPLSWDDPACQEAVDKYSQTVRKDAPWCPDNIEFIRRINGLAHREDVKKTLFDAKYLVMGLGDVYLGAPVATPLDPRHRLVTTKYNPARTWTAENSVGIGGAYLCVYGMEGPGGYQFVGRTVQMWNRYRSSALFQQPWLLRFFDQICFYEVSADELPQIRKDFINGQYPIRIEEDTFSYREYLALLADHGDEIQRFTQQREQAFSEELEDWKRKGLLSFDAEEALGSSSQEVELPEGATFVESSVAGSVWQQCVEKGTQVKQGDPLFILESMKMEISIDAPISGVITDLIRSPGDAIEPGQPLAVLTEAEA